MTGKNGHLSQIRQHCDLDLAVNVKPSRPVLPRRKSHAHAEYYTQTSSSYRGDGERADRQPQTGRRTAYAIDTIYIIEISPLFLITYENKQTCKRNHVPHTHDYIHIHTFIYIYTCAHTRDSRVFTAI